MQPLVEHPGLEQYMNTKIALYLAAPFGINSQTSRSNNLSCNGIAADLTESTNIYMYVLTHGQHTRRYIFAAANVITIHSES